MMWSQPRKKSTSSSHNEVDILNLYKTIEEDLARGGDLLNQRQCQDLASKLSRTAQNVGEVVLSCGGSSPLFRPTLEDLYRYFEKAMVLVRECGDKDWCAAAVFQSQNENAFRDILLDVGLCYNAIYEQAKRKSRDRIDLPDDLRLSSAFDPAPQSDVDGDKEDLLKRLNDLANNHTGINFWDKWISGRGARMQSLAKNLLEKMYCTSKEPQADNLDSFSAMLWETSSEPSATWGIISGLLGAGSGALGVLRTEWLGIPCAKKEFHGQEYDPFFLKEAGILAHLKHPCIVNLICCGNGLKKGDRFIAMELMEKSLFDLIEEQKEQKDEPFSVPVAVDMMVQIARGVCYLHDRGVAHRDLKPQNVVVSRLTSPHPSGDHFSVKLVDFGMSKTKVEVSKSNTMTAAGIGTTRYRAPEVFPQAYRSGRGKADWFKADVYSFAMTCAHLLSLKSPFEEMQNPGALYEKLGKGERPELLPDCPKELVGLLKKCWSTRRGSRPDFKDICVQLETFRHAFLRGCGGANEGVQDITVDLSVTCFEFIKGKVNRQSAIQTPLVDDEEEEEEEMLYDGEIPSHTQLNFLNSSQPIEIASQECGVGAYYKLNAGMTSFQRRNKSTSSSHIDVDILNLCKTIVEDLARGGNLLNQRQCQDLASKLSSTAQNVEELVSSLKGSCQFFRPALENLYRYFEKAKVLVSNCGDQDWCAAAVFQSQNENAFRDILLDVGLCYNAIYEQAKRKSDEGIVLPHDLRQSSMFEPASDSDVDADQADLLERLDDLANGHSDIKGWDTWIARKQARMQSLANYLLVKMYCTSKELQADNLDSFSAMLWTRASEPSGTWGWPHFLGAGSGANGVCCTTWLGIPCAKKEFHEQDSETCFLKDAGILAHLKHPCIVNLICCGNGLEKGDRFTAVELMEKSLFDLIEEQKEQKGVPFSLPVAVDMMVQIARGVCYLHDRGVAHRDLKPQNVVVSRVTSPHLTEDHLSVKLVDFGMSKTKVEVSKSNTMTAAGIGTTRYMAPEVCPQAHRNGTRKADWLKADVYSFAMTCAHLLSLTTPFGELQNLGTLHEMLVKGERPELPVGCPKELVELLEKCWSIRPGSRPSFMQVCIELEKFRHAFFRRYGDAREGVQGSIVFMRVGFDFIEGMVEKQSALHAPLLDCIDLV